MWGSTYVWNGRYRSELRSPINEAHIKFGKFFLPLIFLPVCSLEREILEKTNRLLSFQDTDSVENTASNSSSIVACVFIVEENAYRALA
jgi:hypothetical protein